jgi:hypothetical protein
MARKTKEETVVSVKEPIHICALLCGLLETLGTLSEEIFIESLASYGIVSHFDLYDALSLIEQGGLAEYFDGEGSRRYRVKAKGIEIAREFRNSIPSELYNYAMTQTKRIKREADLKKTYRWGVRQEEHGFTFRFCHFNDKTDILDVKIYATTMETAEKIQKKFLANATCVSEKIIKALI